MENNQTASRAARRFLSDRVRDDWDWPEAPACWSASDEEVRGVSEFRERYYGTSCSESEPEPESESEANTDAAADPYKFDSPDSIGDAVERKALRRKRKRRAALESEATWNEGLACFLARRDAWTGAAAVKKYGTQRPAKAAQKTPPETGSPETEPTETGPTETGPTETGPTETGPSQTEPPPETSSTNAPVEPLIPLAPPLLADNAIRNSITSRTYPDIYNKIVVSSRSPSVPINLADMTKALVQGWKDNGEWPPKAGPLDPLAGKKRALVGVRVENGDAPFLVHHPHVKKGMESVKRIFHLNGPHHEHGAVGSNG